MMMEFRGRQHKDSLFVFTDHITAVSHMNKKGKSSVIVVSLMHHDNGMEPNEERKKPEMIIDYNETKADVDVVDSPRLYEG